MTERQASKGFHLHGRTGRRPSGPKPPGPKAPGSFPDPAPSAMAASARNGIAETCRRASGSCFSGDAPRERPNPAKWTKASGPKSRPAALTGPTSPGQPASAFSSSRQSRTGSSLSMAGPGLPPSPGSVTPSGIRDAVSARIFLDIVP